MPLIFEHPIYGKLLKFLEKTAGRDKLMRLIQYWSRFLSFVLLRNGYSKSTIKFWKTIQEQLGLARKLFRAGKPLGFYKNAAGAYKQKTVDPILRFTSIWKNIFQGSYLFLDFFVWLHKSGVKPQEKTRFSQLLKFSYQFWFAALVCSIVNNGYKLNRAVQTKQALQTEKEKDIESLKIADRKEKDAAKLLAWDVLDLSIPGSALGYASFLDDGIVGLAGFITSFWGLEQIWESL